MFRLFTSSLRRRGQDSEQTTGNPNSPTIATREGAAARAFAALAHPVRRNIIRLLREQPMHASELASLCDISNATLVTHLNVLKMAGLISTERQRTSVQYRLNLRRLEEITAAVGNSVETSNIPPARPALPTIKHP